MSAKPEPKAESKKKEFSTGEFVDMHQGTFEDKDKNVFNVVETQVRCRPLGALMLACSAEAPTQGQIRIFDQNTKEWLPVQVTDTLITLQGPVTFFSVGPGPLLLDCTLHGERTPTDSAPGSAIKVKRIERRQHHLSVVSPVIEAATATPFGDIRKTKKDAMLEFCGAENSSVPAMLFHCLLEHPPQGCKYGFIQTCTGYRRYVRLNGQERLFTTNGKPFLDTTLPYKCEEGEEDGFLELEAEDSPGTPLYPACKEVEVDEIFHMYLACKTELGPWTTFARATWAWKALAQRADANSEWTIKSKKVPTEAVDFEPTNEQARWEGNVESLQKAIMKEFSEGKEDASKDRKDGT